MVIGRRKQIVNIKSLRNIIDCRNKGDKIINLVFLRRKSCIVKKTLFSKVCSMYYHVLFKIS